MKIKLPRKLRVQVLAGKVLGVSVYRRYAPLSLPARISKADIYDAKANPTGTQRDLSPKHAKEAYEYVRDRQLAYWPEVFLCVREPHVFKFTPRPNGDPQWGELAINMTVVKRCPRIAILRTDGNHRLHYADGHDPQFPPLDRAVSFCL